MKNLKIKEIISEKKIQNRVKELGEELAKKFKSKDVIAVSVLKGSFIFFSDLTRSLDFDLKYDFIELSSYLDSESSKNVKIIKDLSLAITKKHVIIVEDIVENGYTLNLLQKLLQLRNPASITTVSLLHKPKSKKVDYNLDYIGFDISDNGFVLGYGLDYNNQYRNLPYIAEIQNLN